MYTILYSYTCTVIVCTVDLMFMYMIATAGWESTAVAY